MSSCDNSNIRKNYIVQGNSDDIISACTGVYTNNLYNCTGDTLTIQSTNLSANTINASIYLSGGTNILDIVNTNDTFLTGQTFNNSTYILTSERNDGVAFNTDLSVLASDIFVLSGVYNPSTGIVTYTNSTGGTFQVSGFTTGMTDSFTTNAHLSGNQLRFDNNIQGSNFYNVDLSPIVFSGGSGSCISNLYISNLYGCSPITIHDSLQHTGSTASGTFSTAFGSNTTASGQNSHAEGAETIASGNTSHAEGSNTRASGDYSHAEGSDTIASGNTSHAEGRQTTAGGDYSHAEGYATTASGYESHAEGTNTISSGSHSHAEGRGTIASGNTSHAEGRETVAIGSGAISHAEGSDTFASGGYSHAEVT